MKITRQDVLHVADLAHLELSDTEVETYLRQLDEILTYVDKLNELDTSQVEPMAQVLSPATAESPALRDDTPRPQAVVEAVLSIAPDPAPPYIRVPKVIDR